MVKSQIKIPHPFSFVANLCTIVTIIKQIRNLIDILLAPTPNVVPSRDDSLMDEIQSKQKNDLNLLNHLNH